MHDQNPRGSGFREREPHLYAHGDAVKLSVNEKKRRNELAKEVMLTLCQSENIQHGIMAIGFEKACFSIANTSYGIADAMLEHEKKEV
jgi:hypothetical protein